MANLPLFRTGLLCSGRPGSSTILPNRTDASRASLREPAAGGLLNEFGYQSAWPPELSLDELAACFARGGPH